MCYISINQIYTYIAPPLEKLMKFNIIILTAQYYGIPHQSSILHILYNYHPEILVLKIGWSLINSKDFTFIGKALGLTV